MSDKRVAQVLLHYSIYRGDHSADAVKILELDEATTLAELLLIVATNSRVGDEAHIQIVLKEAKP